MRLQLLLVDLSNDYMDLLHDIAFVGLMGSGKTTIGNLISSQFGLNLIDLDEYITTKHKMSISEIFQVYDEDWFRFEETKVLEEVVNLIQTRNCKSNNVKTLCSTDCCNHYVLALGGGTFVNDHNIILVQKVFKTIYLRASVDTIVNHLSKDNDSIHQRPLLNHINCKTELRDKINDLLNFRSRFYNLADIIIDIDNLSENDIISYIIRTLDNLD